MGADGGIWMAEYIDLDTPLELKAVWGNTYKPYTSTLRELLDTNHIPYTAADVRPVVRGKWSRIDYEPHGHDYKCSACEWKNDMPTLFCPKCGARMEES
jgi:hypothetical protein